MVLQHAGHGFHYLVVDSVTPVGVHCHIHSVPGSTDSGAEAQEQLQLGLHCPPIPGWPDLLCHWGLRCADRYRFGTVAFCLLYCNVVPVLVSTSAILLLAGKCMAAFTHDVDDALCLLPSVC